MKWAEKLTDGGSMQRATSEVKGKESRIRAAGSIPPRGASDVALKKKAAPGTTGAAKSELHDPGPRDPGMVELPRACGGAGARARAYRMFVFEDFSRGTSKASGVAARAAFWVASAGVVVGTCMPLAKIWSAMVIPRGTPPIIFLAVPRFE